MSIKQVPLCWENYVKHSNTLIFLMHEFIVISRLRIEWVWESKSRTDQSFLSCICVLALGLEWAAQLLARVLTRETDKLHPLVCRLQIIWQHLRLASSVQNTHIKHSSIYFTQNYLETYRTLLYKLSFVFKKIKPKFNNWFLIGVFLSWYTLYSTYLD